jgi:hypothetical protein
LTVAKSVAAVALLAIAFGFVDAHGGQGFTDQATMAVIWIPFAVYVFVRPLRRRR